MITAVAAVFYLVVNVMSHGAQINQLYYKLSTFPTQAACEDFTKSSEGAASLDGLLDAVHTQSDPEATLVPVCTTDGPAQP